MTRCFLIALLSVLFPIAEAKVPDSVKKFMNENSTSINVPIEGKDGFTFLKYLFSDETKADIRKGLGQKKELLKLHASMAEILTKKGRADLIQPFQEAIQSEFGPIYEKNEIDNSPNCDGVDLRTKESQSFEVPREQQDTAWCTAFSAARLLEQRLGYQVSPVDLIIQFYRRHPEFNEKGKTPLDGAYGQTQMVINDVASQIGVCEEKNLPAAALDCGKDNQSNHTISALRNFGKDLDTFLAEEPGQRDLILSKIFPNLTKEQRNAIFTSDDRKPNVLRLAGQACANRKAAPFKAIAKLRGDDPAQLLKELDNQLYSKKKFVGVYIPIAWGNEIQLNPHYLYQHAMTVVGRFMDPQTKECSYILEDSSWSTRKSQANARMDGPYTIITRTNMLRSMSVIHYLD